MLADFQAKTLIFRARYDRAKTTAILGSATENFKLQQLMPLDVVKQRIDKQPASTDVAQFSNRDWHPMLKD